MSIEIRHSGPDARVEWGDEAYSRITPLTPSGAGWLADNMSGIGAETMDDGNMSYPILTCYLSRITRRMLEEGLELENN